MLAELHAKAAISNFYQKQNAETQKSGDDQKQAIKELKHEMIRKQQELRNLERSREQALWEETKKQKKMAIDMKKLTKQISNLEKQLKQKEAADGDSPENEELIKSLQDKLVYAEREHDLIKQQYKDIKARSKDFENRLIVAEEDLHQKQRDADIAADLEAAEAEVKMLKKQLEVCSPYYHTLALAVLAQPSVLYFVLSCHFLYHILIAVC
ncbi:hypothetical protein LSH36_631g02005 [Paralvinella palmiformis]|uniref:Uncharacterized protein n=1 Tax=Paralvinella palmiformis TaxID=53620 RepID=A0AAD9J3R3_9ANNE|nr:hypothetical protein LSH36_631g02005 [Paralvinella palmiformis]